MSHHFTLRQTRVQWGSSGFMVAMTVSMLTTPWLLSRFGYRRTYEMCMVMLMSGGVGGGLASDYSGVLVARLVEGLAAGVVLFGAGDMPARLQAFHDTFWFLAVLTALAIVPAWLMAAPEHKKD